MNLHLSHFLPVPVSYCLSMPIFLSLSISQHASWPLMSFHISCMCRTTHLPSQAPASRSASGSLPQRKRFCSMTTSWLSTIASIRSVCLFSRKCVFVAMCFQSVLVFTCVLSLRLWMMWKRDSSKWEKNPTSSKSSLNRGKWPWSVTKQCKFRVIGISGGLWVKGIIDPKN